MSGGPTHLYAWRRGTPPQRVGVLQAREGVYALAEGPPELASALAKAQAEPHLPLTIRQDVNGNRSISLKRLSPGEPDYWRALGEALERQVGFVLTSSEKPDA
ncbi:MAG: hypothetical protein JWM80_2522 [Cyanobacteria bacterium RYN_339]|nr:hypothetical protein [Cyanobacteria bacterium RYN_339]